MSETPRRYQDIEYLYLSEQNLGCSLKVTQVFCTYEVTSFDLYFDRSIVDSNYLPIATNDRVMSAPSTGPALQAYGAKNNPCNNW